MLDLSTSYMGIKLTNPFVVAASSISSYVDRAKAAERAGAAALVVRSLFEEQVQFDALRLENELAVGSESFAEALTYFPSMTHGGAEEHLMWVEKTVAELKIPVIASLNAVTPATWVSYARKLEATGVAGLELNLYSVPTKSKVSSATIEEQMLQVVGSVVEAIGIPVSVKLSPFFTSLPNFAAALDERGAQALVLFNRFLQPDIDLGTQSLKSEMIYSSPQEMKLPLRWVALLSGRIKADLALNTGVHSGMDAARALLAGANVVQIASAMLIHGIPFLSTMLREFEAWMNEQGYADLAEMRGKLSQKQAEDPLALERAHYVKLLLEQK